MKKYSLILISAFSFAACNSEVKTNTESTPSATETPTKLAANLDPICNMEKENTWTEFAASNSDTTWFCSPHCKEVFEKNPEKYSHSAQH